MLAWLRSLVRRRAPAPPPTIALTATGFAVRESGGAEVTVDWADVRRALAYKRDLYTADCIMLAFERDATPHVIEIAESWPGFSELFGAMETALGVSAEWYLLTMLPAFEPTPRVIYERAPVIVWRDSVAMGDDVDAPHEWVAPVPRDGPLAAVGDAIIGARYLASIAGGRATWILDGERPLAVLAQQWDAPRWLVDPSVTASAFARRGGAPDFELRYWCQVDPERVYECLRAGEPLPDRYGR